MISPEELITTEHVPHYWSGKKVAQALSDSQTATLDTLTGLSESRRESCSAIKTAMFSEDGLPSANASSSFKNLWSRRSTTVLTFAFNSPKSITTPALFRLLPATHTST